VQFGSLLRSLRSERGIGLKRLAPDLGVTHGYLSKLENEQTRPSEAFVRRVAEYFSYDADALLLAADRIPPDVLTILQANPDEAITFLRERFGHAANPARSASSND
jgi:transcriptional regulator with XRE-family HTH domain